MERIRSTQAGVLGLVLDPQRLARLIEAEARLGDDAYAPIDMLADLREGLWQELSARSPLVDPWRRNLQRAYLERMKDLMTEEVTPPSAAAREFLGYTPVRVSQSDIRAYVRGELEALREEVGEVISRTDDRATRLHFDDVLVRIEEILDPTRRR